MDFSNRSSQQASGPRLGSVFSPQNNGDDSRDNKDAKDSKKGGVKNKLHPSKWVSGLSLLVLFGTALLILALIGWLITSHDSESSLVDSKKLQAVFLTNNQVYFGKVTSLNRNYLVLNDIYYLQQQSSGTNATASSGNIQLIKLGCELHKPTDQMVVNRSEVEFWENLQSDGQVATAVKNYQSSGKHTCSNTTTNNNSSVQGSSTTDNSNSSTDSSNSNSNNANSTNNSSTGQ
jgi:hypothetical protein